MTKPNNQAEIEMEPLKPEIKILSIQRAQNNEERLCQRMHGRIKEHPCEVAFAGILMLSGIALMIYGLCRAYIADDDIVQVVSYHNETQHYSSEEKNLLIDALKTNNPTLIISGILMFFSPLLIDYVRKKLDIVKPESKIDQEEFDNLSQRVKVIEEKLEISVDQNPDTKLKTSTIPAYENERIS